MSLSKRTATDRESNHARDTSTSEARSDSLPPPPAQALVDRDRHVGGGVGTTGDADVDAMVAYSPLIEVTVEGLP